MISSTSIDYVKSNLSRLTGLVSKNEKLHSLCSSYLESNHGDMLNYIVPFLIALKNDYSGKNYLFVYESIHYIIQTSVSEAQICSSDRKSFSKVTTENVSFEKSIDQNSDLPIQNQIIQSERDEGINDIIIEEDRNDPTLPPNIDQTNSNDIKSRPSPQFHNLIDKNEPQKGLSKNIRVSKDILESIGEHFNDSNKVSMNKNCETNTAYFNSKKSISPMTSDKKLTDDETLVQIDCLEYLIETYLDILIERELDVKIKILQTISMIIPETKGDILFKIFYNVVHVMDCKDKKLANIIQGIILQLVTSVFDRFEKCTKCFDGIWLLDLVFDKELLFLKDNMSETMRQKFMRHILNVCQRNNIVCEAIKPALSQIDENEVYDLSFEKNAEIFDLEKSEAIKNGFLKNMEDKNTLVLENEESVDKKSKTYGTLYLYNTGSMDLDAESKEKNNQFSSKYFLNDYRPLTLPISNLTAHPNNICPQNIERIKSVYFDCKRMLFELYQLFSQTKTQEGNVFMLLTLDLLRIVVKCKPLFCFRETAIIFENVLEEIYALKNGTDGSYDVLKKVNELFFLSLEVYFQTKKDFLSVCGDQSSHFNKNYNEWEKNHHQYQDSQAKRKCAFTNYPSFFDSPYKKIRKIISRVVQSPTFLQDKTFIYKLTSKNFILFENLEMGAESPELIKALNKDVSYEKFLNEIYQHLINSWDKGAMNLSTLNLYMNILTTIKPNSDFILKNIKEILPIALFLQKTEFSEYLLQFEDNFVTYCSVVLDSSSSVTTEFALVFDKIFGSNYHKIYEKMVSGTSLSFNDCKKYFSKKELFSNVSFENISENPRNRFHENSSNFISEDHAHQGFLFKNGKSYELFVDSGFILWRLVEKENLKYNLGKSEPNFDKNIKICCNKSNNFCCISSDMVEFGNMEFTSKQNAINNIPKNSTKEVSVKTEKDQLLVDESKNNASSNVAKNDSPHHQQEHSIAQAQVIDKISNGSEDELKILTQNSELSKIDTCRIHYDPVYNHNKESSKQPPIETKGDSKGRRWLFFRLKPTEQIDQPKSPLYSQIKIEEKEIIYDIISKSVQLPIADFEKLVLSTDNVHFLKKIFYANAARISNALCALIHILSVLYGDTKTLTTLINDYFKQSLQFDIETEGVPLYFLYGRAANKSLIEMLSGVYDESKSGLFHLKLFYERFLACFYNTQLCALNIETSNLQSNNILQFSDCNENFEKVSESSNNSILYHQDTQNKREYICEDRCNQIYLNTNSFDLLQNEIEPVSLPKDTGQPIDRYSSNTNVQNSKYYENQHGREYLSIHPNITGAVLNNKNKFESVKQDILTDIPDAKVGNKQKEIIVLKSPQASNNSQSNNNFEPLSISKPCGFSKEISTFYKNLYDQYSKSESILTYHDYFKIYKNPVSLDISERKSILECLNLFLRINSESICYNWSLIYKIIDLCLGYHDLTDLNLRILMNISENFLGSLENTYRIKTLKCLVRLALMKPNLNSVLQIMGVISDLQECYILKPCIYANQTKTSVESELLESVKIQKTIHENDSSVRTDKNLNEVPKFTETKIVQKQGKPDTYHHQKRPTIGSAVDGLNIMTSSLDACLSYILSVLTIIKSIKHNDILETGLRILISYRDLNEDGKILNHIFFNHVFPEFIILSHELKIFCSCEIEENNQRCQSLKNKFKIFSNAVSKNNLSENIFLFDTILDKNQSTLIQNYTSGCEKPPLMNKDLDYQNYNGLNHHKADFVLNSQDMHVLRYLITIKSIDSKVYKHLHSLVDVINTFNQKSEYHETYFDLPQYNINLENCPTKNNKSVQSEIKNTAIHEENSEKYNIMKNMGSNVGMFSGGLENMDSDTGISDVDCENMALYTAFDIIIDHCKQTTEESYENRSRNKDTFMLIFNEIVRYIKKYSYYDYKIHDRFCLTYLLAISNALLKTRNLQTRGSQKHLTEICTFLVNSLDLFQDYMFYNNILRHIMQEIVLDSYSSNGLYFDESIYEKVLQLYGRIVNREAPFYEPFCRFIETNNTTVVEIILNLMYSDCNDHVFEVYSRFLDICDTNIAKKIIYQVTKVLSSKSSRICIKNEDTPLKSKNDTSRQKQTNLLGQPCEYINLDPTDDDVLTHDDNGSKLFELTSTQDFCDEKNKKNTFETSMMDSIESKGYASSISNKDHAENFVLSKTATLKNQNKLTINKKSQKRHTAIENVDKSEKKCEIIGSSSKTSPYSSNKTGKPIPTPKNLPRACENEKATSEFLFSSTSQENNNFDSESNKNPKNLDCIKSTDIFFISEKFPSPACLFRKYSPIVLNTNLLSTYNVCNDVPFDCENMYSCSKDSLEPQNNYRNTHNTTDGLKKSYKNPISSHKISNRIFFHLLQKITEFVHEHALTEACLNCLKTFLTYSKQTPQTIEFMIKNLYFIFEKELENSENDNIQTYFGALTISNQNIKIDDSSYETDSCQSNLSNGNICPSFRNIERQKESLYEDFIEAFVQTSVNFIIENMSANKQPLEISRKNLSNDELYFYDTLYNESFYYGLLDEIFNIISRLSIVKLGAKREHLAFRAMSLLFIHKKYSRNIVINRLKTVLKNFVIEENIYKDLYPRLKRTEVYLLLDHLIDHSELVSEVRNEIVECLGARDYNVIDKIKVCLQKSLH